MCVPGIFTYDAHTFARMICSVVADGGLSLERCLLGLVYFFGYVFGLCENVAL